MNTTIARPTAPRRRLPADRARFPYRATPPAFIAPTPPACASTATHDFLVPNPRPDLTSDLQTLAMIDTSSF